MSVLILIIKILLLQFVLTLQYKDFKSSSHPTVVTFTWGCEKRLCVLNSL